MTSESERHFCWGRALHDPSRPSPPHPLLTPHSSLLPPHSSLLTPHSSLLLPLAVLQFRTRHIQQPVFQNDMADFGCPEESHGVGEVF